MTQPVKFYFDLLSQQCRALYMFLEATKIPYEPIPVSILKGEHLKKDVKEKLNHLQTIPTIDDHGFKLAQPIAIFRHLVREKLVPEHWYPRHSLARSRIDEFLEWQNNHMRPTCNDYFQLKWLQPATSYSKPDNEDIKIATERLNRCLNDFHNHWLRTHQYLVGRNISIADLLAICEIDQPKMIGYDPFKNRPKLHDWYNLVRETMDHFYDEANQPVLEKLMHNNNNNNNSNNNDDKNKLFSAVA